MERNSKYLTTRNGLHGNESDTFLCTKIHGCVTIALLAVSVSVIGIASVLGLHTAVLETFPDELIMLTFMATVASRLL